MALSLASIVDPNRSRAQQPLILVQSSASQTSLPVLRSLIQPAKCPVQTLLFCFLYPPTSLIPDWPNTLDDSLKVFNYTDRVPGYDETQDLRNDILAVIESAPPGALRVVIDSVDTLAADLASDSRTYKFIGRLLNLIAIRSPQSVLILHLLYCPLLPMLTQTRLSPTLTHIIAHPPSLLAHLASSYLVLPPPAGPAEKFWTVFTPVSERLHEIEALVYGPEGVGTCSGGGDLREFVVEVLVRGTAAEGRRRGIERTIEGWSDINPVHLQKLDGLKSIWSRSKSNDETLIDTQTVPFNLKLTPSQEKARADVPLPYAHEGKFVSPAPPVKGAILYEPDSADDIDDDDPDEDLDI